VFILAPTVQAASDAEEEEIERSKKEVRKK
jgi:hypothetical protein